jgi:hypothetical protein
MASKPRTRAVAPTASAARAKPADAPVAPADPPRRGPGRPPKRQPPPALEFNGVVRDPSDPENIVEIVYGTPTMFKQMFTYFKNIHARDIHVKFSPPAPGSDEDAAFTLFTRDAARQCRVVARIPGVAMNHFYCERVVMFGLKRDDIEKVFSSIDKSFFKITFLFRHDDPENLTVIFKDADIDKDCNYKLAIAAFDPDEALFDSEREMLPEALEAFPVSFTLSSKQFKKTVTDASNYSDTLTVEKVGDQPLMLSYDRVNLVFREVYHSDKKIQLKHAIGPDEAFQCPMPVREVKAFAAAMVTEEVQILCRNDGDLMFRAFMDALVLCTFMSTV